MAGGPTLPGRAAHPHLGTVDGVQLRQLVPRVLSVLVCRGADFATAEDAVQEALTAWGDQLPADSTGWLITVAWRAFLDMTRSDAARRDRELRFDTEPPAGAIPSTDDTLRLYFLGAHPDLTSSSAVALTLRGVGGLTTRQIARAYLVPERTMAQRISRAKRLVSRAGVDRPGDVRTIMRALYLVFNEGYSGDVDLAAEAIRLTRQLAVLLDDPEVHGLLALMLLHQARRRSRTARTVASSRSPIRTAASGTPGSLPRESTSHKLRSGAINSANTRRKRRSLRSMPTRRVSRRPTGSRSWSGTTSYSASPTLRSSGSTVWSQSARPTAPPAGLAALAEVDEDVPRREAVAAYLHEKNGDLELAARLYASAARHASNLAERDHQTRQAARLNQHLQQHR
jgi:DNA-directed RNA polymerase specialized sigma24 family protein